MFHLPKTISPEIRRKLQKYLQSQDIAAGLCGVATGTRELFLAQECLLVFSAESLAEPLVCFSAEEGEYAEQFNSRLWQTWTSTGVHERLTKDLLTRLSAISYSAFSWPYARIQVEKSVVSGERYAMPRDYTIFIPISSDMVVRGAEEPAFFGYLGVFFSVFPQISDEVVQLITTLPTLVSEISAAYLRN